MNPQTLPAQDPLANLRDIHLPDAIGLWPLAPGWWAVIVVACGLLIALTLLFTRHRNRTAFKRAAHKQLTLINQSSLDDSHYIKQLNQLLKQTTLANHSRTEISKLSGNDWLLFLEHHTAPGAFSQSAGRIFATGPYQAQLPEFEREEIYALINNWIKRQPPQC